MTYKRLIEEILETYHVANNMVVDMKSPDTLTVIFNNLEGSERDWISTQKKVAFKLLRNPETELGQIIEGGEFQKK